LMLFSLRALKPGRTWNDGTIWFAFWAINSGLMAMLLLSLLPVGLMQTWASVEHGYWYARSAEFLQSPVIGRFRWLRVVGDTIFAAGCVAFVWFIFGLSTGYSYKKELAGADLPGSEPAYSPPRA